MIFEQLFDTKSSTYTYIISSGKGREALIIDPVIENTNEYLKILKKLDLKLVKVIDTHIHTDHISGLNELSKKTNCTKIMGEQSTSEVIDIKIKDNDKINIENIEQRNKPNSKTFIDMVIVVVNIIQLNNVLDKLRGLPHIISASRY